MEKNTVVIFTAKLARKLLKDGEHLVDIKPDKLDRSGKRSVFVFEKTERLSEVLKGYTDCV